MLSERVWNVWDLKSLSPIIDQWLCWVRYINSGRNFDRHSIILFTICLAWPTLFRPFLCAPKSFCQNKLRISIWSKISCGWSFFELIRCRQALNRGSWIHFSSYIKCHLVAVFDILSESFFGHRSLLIRRLETFWRSFQWEFSTHRRETFKCLLGNV